MDCTHSKNCQLYAQFAMEPSLQLWKQRYCASEYEKCARYQLALEGQSVPLALLPNGRRVKQRSKEQISAVALFNAILKQRVSMVKSMLKVGLPSERMASSDGMTLLMASASVGNTELVELMLENGCNPYAKNLKGETALDISLRSGFSDCAVLIESALSVKSVEEYEIQHTSSAQEDDSSPTGIINFFKKLIPLN